MQFSCLFSLAESEGILRSHAKALSVGVSLTIGLYMDGWYLTVDQFLWEVIVNLRKYNKEVGLDVKITQNKEFKVW